MGGRKGWGPMFAVVLTAVSGTARADETAPAAAASPGPELHYEAAAVIGARTIGDEERQAGESALVDALRLSAAVGPLWRPPGRRVELGLHAIFAGTIAGRGGGLSAGGDFLVRRWLGAAHALDARVAVLAGLVGDDGNPPLLVAPGVGLAFGSSASFELRIEGEIATRDIGDGLGYGVLGGVAMSGKRGLVASAIVVAVGAAIFGIALTQLGD